ncbi:hypothetical protein [Oligoflexus tunisiensis]|uniref:hypothetical protein n=1 Tax=Oligoflexus tunisiensis TaxID=708132 RepID=UPI00114CE2B6|nr:hypothetical protein [Oligoflexus tunisiensis]
MRALFVSILIWSDTALAGEFGVWGRVTSFSKGETWVTYGVLLKDYYTAAVTHTQDGSAVEFGLAYELGRLGMTTNMVHLSAGHIAQIVDIKEAGGPRKFNGRYSMLSFNYSIFFAGARLVERDIDSDLEQKRGRVVKKSISDFFLGVGMFFNPKD